MKKRDSFIYETTFAVFLFLVMAFCIVTVALSVPAIIYLDTNGAYTSSFEEYITETFKSEASRHLDDICNNKLAYRTRMDIEEAFNAEKKINNVGYSIKRRGYQVWSNTEGKESPYVFRCITTNTWADGYYYQTEDYVFTMYVYTDFQKQDGFYRIYQIAAMLYNYRNFFPYVLGFCGVSILIAFVLLVCTAGYKRGREEIVPGALTGVPLDLLTVVSLFIAYFPWEVMDQLDLLRVLKLHSEFFYEEVLAFFLLAVFSVLEIVWFTVFCREIVLRVRMGKWWRNSLILKLSHILWKTLRKLGRFFRMLFQGLPLIIQVAAAVVAVTILEFVGLFVGVNVVNKEIFWILEKVILIPLTLYFALAFKKLQKGSRALAEGNLSYKLDMKSLVLDFREHGENLNRIGEGISRAVEERMQSERLKTELITNVSHDIKTPLTSVINYADLLGTMAQEKEGELDRKKVEEYSEVLLRQSRRLKKLLDDLLEASKATTGNLEVNLAPCELSVLLSQAAGEYEARFAAEKLKLVVHQPEEAIRIMADGRHLWRVFDNLFSNICKYAQEGSRVYLNVERQENMVEVIFRNMSRYELNISPQELEERFVRGDKSRHQEGNGLGLSIAKSLVELQNGTMQLVTDGDLFKVILRFAVLENDYDVTTGMVKNAD